MSYVLLHLTTKTKVSLGWIGNVVKPRGLWFSPAHAENSWEDWCRSKNFATERLVNRHILDIDESRLFIIKSVAALDRFSDEYGRDGWGDDPKEYWTIDWRKLQRETGLNGILISPYQWERRLDGRAHNWYYGWDCASGCIWNPSCVRSIRSEISVAVS